MDTPGTLQFQLGGARRHLFAAGGKRASYFEGSCSILADHNGLLRAEILGGLTVIAPELPIFDMTELVRLKICVELDDTWAWVAMGPERQPDVVASTPTDAECTRLLLRWPSEIPSPVTKHLSTTKSATYHL
ncbi:hypothetical protein Tco_0277021 [Tanacetum coccineum]